MGLSYEKSVKTAYRIIIILGIITISEVVFALLGKGHLIDGFKMPLWIVSTVMIAMSIIKAYLIMYEFMHLKYEVPTLVKTIILPTLLLTWAIFAFFYEGNDWGNRRDLITDRNEQTIQTIAKPVVKNEATKDMGH